MLIMQSGCRTSNQQELLFLILHLSISASIQGQVQGIMAALAGGIKFPYLSILYLATSEHLKLYKKSTFCRTESDNYDLTRSKWTEFYQELEDDVSKFGFKAAVLIVIDIDGVHVPTEVKNIILSYPSITKAMVESHCRII